MLSPTDYGRYLIMYLVLLLIDCFSRISTVFLVIFFDIFFDFILWSCKIVTVCYYTDLEVLIEGLMQTTRPAFVKMLVFEYSEFESFVARCDSCSRQFLLANSQNVAEILAKRATMEQNGFVVLLYIVLHGAL